MRDDLERLIPQIRQVADFVGRRCGLSPEDREDLAGETFLKLAANDYQKLRQFRGEAKFPTYLRVMVSNEANDRLRHERGKYRPATKTRERGPWACRYERLRRIEGRSRTEALEILQLEGFSVPLTELEALDGEIAGRLPPRRFEGSEGLANFADRSLDPEENVLALERAAERKRLRAALGQAVGALPPEDRTFLKLYCEPSTKSRATTLSAMFGLPSKEAVYRRYQELCKDLRRRLRLMGIDSEMVANLLCDWIDDWEKT